MATFNQSNQNVGTQYNAETINLGSGAVTIGAETSPAEMSQIIEAVKSEILKLTLLSEKTRADVVEALNSARNTSPAPTNTDIKAKLDAAGNALASADGVAEKAFSLAQTIFKIGTWVIAAVV